jgi:Ala-tRNA(Pro) deacylase
MTNQVAEETNAAAGGAHPELLRVLDGAGARYRLMFHEAEGRTVAASSLRGHHPSQAAKSLVLRVRMPTGSDRFVLAVVPGNRRVDMDAVSRLVGGRSACFAPREVAENLAGSISGTIMPIAFDERLELVVDPDLLSREEIVFNAGRLDVSVTLATKDYLALIDNGAVVRIHPVATVDSGG